MAISDKLQELLDIKQDIKEAIENKGVDLTGGLQSVTWVINESLNTPINESTFNINFTSNNKSFTQIALSEEWQWQAFILRYEFDAAYFFSTGSWANENYRTITFETAPTGDLLTWLQSNAVKQAEVVEPGVAFDGYAEKIDEIPLQKEEQTKTVSSPNFSSGNVVVTPDADKVLTQVTVVKDDDLVPENIVKDVEIFGVVGTTETGVELTQAQYDALSPDETWVLNGNIQQHNNYFFEVSFISNNQVFEELVIIMWGGKFSLRYKNNDENIVVYNDISWINDAYRTITFETPPTGYLLTWLENNAVKQTSGGAGYDNNTYYLIVEEE